MRITPDMRDQGTVFSPRDMVRSGLCIGCGSCVAQADVSIAHMTLNEYGNLQPTGDADWFRTRSLSFAQTCPFSPVAPDEDALSAALFPHAAAHDPHIGHFQSAYVGYAAEGDYRAAGSSGGMVTWVLAELLQKGLIDGVLHVTAADDPQTDGRFFHYVVSRTLDDVLAGAKSRYYPVELSDVLRIVHSTPGRYAVVGIPCFIKAIHLLRRQDAVVRDRIAFTLALFCGHMKSARFVESFAWQMGVSVDQVQRVEFRRKNPTRPANWYSAQLTLNDGRILQKDWWHLADGDWGAGFFQNSACNFCDDVVGETADISFGDAWVEPYSSDGNGTNVVITRSPVLETLITDGITDGRLSLQGVDADFIERTQAAGFRQRREGLAYRLTWARRGVRPRKRLTPDAKTLPFQRKLIYRMRYAISAWSHRVFWVARLVHQPKVYTLWARAALTIYHGFAYSRGRLGKIVNTLGRQGEQTAKQDDST